MAVQPRLHAECEEAGELRAYYEKQSKMGRGLEGSRLHEILVERQARAYKAHDGICFLCWKYARSCLDCGRDLTHKYHTYGCPRNQQKWRTLFGRAKPPLSHEWRHRPSRPEDPVFEVVDEEEAIPTPRPAPRPVPKPAVKPPSARPAAPKPQAPPRPAAAPQPARAAPPPPKPRPRARPKGPQPHAVLGVAFDAELPEIAAAYRARVKQYHPDKVATLGEELRLKAEEKMRDINLAYEAMKKAVAGRAKPTA